MGFVRPCLETVGRRRQGGEQAEEASFGMRATRENATLQPQPVVITKSALLGTMTIVHGPHTCVSPCILRETATRIHGGTVVCHRPPRPLLARMGRNLHPIVGIDKCQL